MNKQYVVDVVVPIMVSAKDANEACQKALMDISKHYQDTDCDWINCRKVEETEQ